MPAWLAIVTDWCDENGIDHQELLTRLGVAGELRDRDLLIDQVQGLAYAHRWDNGLAGQILTVIDEQRVWPRFTTGGAR